MMSRMICTYDLDPIPNAATTSATRVALFVWPSDHETKLRTRTLAELRMDALCANHLCRACPHSSTHGWKNTGAVPQLCPRPAARHEGAERRPYRSSALPTSSSRHAGTRAIAISQAGCRGCGSFRVRPAELLQENFDDELASSSGNLLAVIPWNYSWLSGWWVGDCIPAGD